MPNEKDMARKLLVEIEEIRDYDPGAFIVVCAAGRAAKYLAVQAMLMGVHVRMGKEDTVWKYPNKNEYIERNVDEMRDAIAIAKMLGREMMTPNEYRVAQGLKPRHDFAPKGGKMPEGKKMS